MSPYWKIYPSRPVKGFTATYMPREEGTASELSAVLEAMRMEKYSGVRWCVVAVLRNN